MIAPAPDRRASLSLAWILALIFLGAAYRIAVPVFDLPGNTAPLMALTFGGAMLLGVRFWWVPLAILVSSDLALGFFPPAKGIGAYTLMSAVFYGATAWLGASARLRCRLWPMMWCGTLLCGVVFYVVANTFSWLYWPGYEKSLAGWWQCQTWGLPGYPPSWIFLRNSLIADTLWCGLAGLVYVLFRRPQAENLAPVGVRR